MQLDSDSDFRHALSKDREKMQRRYVEVFPASESEFALHLAQNGRNVSTMYDSESGSGGGGVVKLRGLPFNLTTHDLRVFFRGLGIREEGIVFCEVRLVCPG